MRTYAVTCSTAADLPLDYLKERDIPWVSYTYTLDGRQYLDDGGQSQSFDEFYGRIAAGGMPATSQINVDQFKEFFEPILREGKDILHLELASTVTGSVQSALIVKDILEEAYPGRKIWILDTMGFSAGYGLLVDRAADMRDQGKSIGEVYDWLMENRLRMHHWLCVPDLQHLRRGGRLSAISATVGGLLHIYPMMDIDTEGQLQLRYKPRGAKGATEELMRQIQKDAKDGLAYSDKCWVAHAACYEEGKALAARVEAAFPNLNGPVLVQQIGMVLGAHGGCGFGFAFFGEKR